jgi:hypothetical protein
MPFVRDGAVAHDLGRTSGDSWVKTLPCCKSREGMPMFGTELSTTRLRGFALVALRGELHLAAAPDTGRAGHRLLTAGMRPGDCRATFDRREDQDGRG